MKILAALAAIAGLFAVAPAHAQSNNCSALSGTPAICLENHSSYPIVGVQAASSTTFGNAWVPIPGGMIPPGGMTIVRFPTAWGSDCHKFVVVKTMAGTTHVFPGVDVCHSTKFMVGGW